MVVKARYFETQCSIKQGYESFIKITRLDTNIKAKARKAKVVGQLAALN